MVIYIRFFTPSEKVITGEYPEYHVHLHDIRTAWTKTIYEGRVPGFWNMDDTTGTVKFVKVDTVLTSPEFSGWGSSLCMRKRLIDKV